MKFKKENAKFYVNGEEFADFRTAFAHLKEKFWREARDKQFMKMCVENVTKIYS